MKDPSSKLSRELLQEHAVTPQAVDLIAVFLEDHEVESREFALYVRELEERGLLKGGLLRRMTEFSAPSSSTVQGHSVDVIKTNTCFGSTRSPSPEHGQPLSSSTAVQGASGEGLPGPAARVGVWTPPSAAEIREAIGDECWIEWDFSDVLAVELCFLVLRRHGFLVEMDDRVPGGRIRTPSKFPVVRFWVRSEEDTWRGRTPGVVARLLMPLIAECRQRTRAIVAELGSRDSC